MSNSQLCQRLHRAIPEHLGATPVEMSSSHLCQRLHQAAPQHLCPPVSCNESDFRKHVEEVCENPRQASPVLSRMPCEEPIEAQQRSDSVYFDESIKGPYDDLHVEVDQEVQVEWKNIGAHINKTYSKEYHVNDTLLGVVLPESPETTGVSSNNLGSLPSCPGRGILESAPAIWVADNKGNPAASPNVTRALTFEEHMRLAMQGDRKEVERSDASVHATKNEDSGKGGPSVSVGDEDDGTSPKQLLARIDGVYIRPDYLRERIVLERNMLFTILKFVNFWVYFTHFILSMYEFCPAQHLSTVHRQITHHFHLASLGDVQSLDDVYDFMEDFEHQNEELMATSYHFWCEKRYFSLEWNAHLGIPEKHCYSPRQGALGAPLYDYYECPHCHGVKWADWKSGSVGGHGSASGSHGSTSGSHSSAGSSVSDGSTSGGHGSASAASHGSTSVGHGSASGGQGSTSEGHGSAGSSASHGSTSGGHSSAGSSASHGSTSGGHGSASGGHGSISEGHGSAGSSASHGPTSGDGSASAGHGSASGAASDSQGSAPPSVSGHDTSSSSNNHTSDNGRRLRGEVSPEIRQKAQQRKLAGGGGGGVGDHVCRDFDDLLEEKERIPGITCENHADMVCDLEAGLLLCEKTCGYCPPFEYARTRKFEKPMVTLLPVVVFQSRYPVVPCHEHEYVVAYNGQTTNPNLVILPTLDGNRSDMLLRCVDHSGYVESEYAHHADCPKDHCSDGYFKDTPKSTFHGDTIYPKMLIEPHKDVLGMRHIEWLDRQTKDVSLSTMIYTEDLEIFTSVTIVFSVDKSGSITASKTLQSYKEFLHDEKILFVTNIFIVIASSGLGIFSSIYLLIKDYKHHCNFVSIFELLSRSSLCGFTIYFYVAWQSLKPMHDEFDELIHSFLDVEAHPEEIVQELAKTTHHFFEVKTHIYHENDWVDIMRITAFVMLYLQFIQVILYLNVHPRMALLTRTLSLAWDNIVHFFTLFLAIFLVLAYMVHWLLGGDLFEIFGTFSTAFMSQTRMIFGAWIYSDGVDDLHGVWAAMYWVWAATFLLLVFFILLNFFLAIIVDSFVVVKNLIESQVTEHSFPFDVYDAFASTRKFQSNRWPSRLAVTHTLEEHIPRWGGGGGECKTCCEIDEEDGDKPAMCALELLNLFGSKQALSNFLAYYIAKVPDILAPPPKKEPPPDIDTMSYRAVLATLPSAQLVQIDAFFNNGAKAGVKKFVQSIVRKLEDDERLDWDSVVGRVIRTMHQEFDTKRGHVNSDGATRRRSTVDFSQL